MKYNIFCVGGFNQQNGVFEKSVVGYAEMQPNGRIYQHFNAVCITGTSYLEPIEEITIKDVSCEKLSNEKG